MMYSKRHPPDIEQWSRAVAPTSSRGGLVLALPPFHGLMEGGAHPSDRTRARERKRYFTVVPRPLEDAQPPGTPLGSP